jgi:hypothetical protein
LQAEQSARLVAANELQPDGHRSSRYASVEAQDDFVGRRMRLV